MARPVASHVSTPGFRDSFFLLTVGIISLICGVVSFYAWQTLHSPAVSATASAEDDAPRMPLPAGPRKYQ